MFHPYGKYSAFPVSNFKKGVDMQRGQKSQWLLLQAVYSFAALFGLW